MRLRKITLREIHLPLIAPFETSFGVSELRRILLIETDVDGVIGWGEATAGEDPYYSYETVETAWLIIRDYLWPLLRGKDFASAADVWEMLALVRGHNMAKGGPRSGDLGCGGETEEYAAGEAAGRDAG